MRTLKIISFVVILSFMAGGCDPNFNYDGPRAQPGAMASQTEWKVTGTPGQFSFLSFAHDGNAMTVCQSKGYSRGTAITIDFSRPCMFNMIAIQHGPFEFGYAKEVAVEISNDGKNFTRIFNGEGTRKITYLCILSPVKARYVRLVAIRPGIDKWSIAEIYFQ